MISAFRQFAKELTSVRFSGASGPVEFQGADRMGIINVHQYVGNRSRQIGQYKSNKQNKKQQLTLDLSAIFWLGGEKPSDGRQGGLFFLALDVSLVVEKQSKTFSFYQTPSLFINQSILHFAPDRPVHTNTISTVEASSHTAIAAQKLFVLIILSLESHHCLLPGIY